MRKRNAPYAFSDEVIDVTAAKAFRADLSAMPKARDGAPIVHPIMYTYYCERPSDERERKVGEQRACRC